MTAIESMAKYLVDKPKARERRYKDLAMAHRLVRRYGLDIEPQTLREVLQDYGTMDRAWRKVLQDNPELRGSDYEKGYELAVKKMDELGYDVQTANYLATK